MGRLISLGVSNLGIEGTHVNLALARVTTMGYQAQRLKAPPFSWLGAGGRDYRCIAPTRDRR